MTCPYIASPVGQKMITSPIVAMTDVEKMQSLDLPMSLLMIGMGACFLALRSKMAVARQVHVQKGEMTAEEAKKKDRLVFWCSSGVVARGTFVFVMWVTGH